ncbi:RPA-related protein RADX [Gouania willdenowi]|uniref:RPA-related protein RADX-like n=1 Tax=Gouania willdenowi TaxID=441366 RepID=A0A8C5E8X3_GOUWI|nr:RPA-related protein RADX [Gouania willdenowi]
MEAHSSSSAGVSSGSRASSLQTLLDRLSGPPCVRLGPWEEVSVAVISLQRYLSDQNDAHLQTDSFSYDVTVTDGLWRTKCLLHSSLNQLVHVNTLRTGTDITITQCSFIYNEHRLGHGYLCIEKLRCAAGRSALLSGVNDPSSLPVLVKQGMERNVVLHSDVPLQVSRKHYLSLWNNEDPEGDMWSSDPPHPNTVLDVSSVTLLSSLESSFTNIRKPLPLLVKIIHKSRLRYYGKFGLKIDYPYQAYFEVADKSGTMSLVLWNDLCPQFFQRLKVGSVLYLQNYSLKPSYSNRSRPQMDHLHMKSFSSVEICLNPRNPEADITVVSPKSVLPQWGLPTLSYQFTTRAELDQLPINSACDVIGLVTFVGRAERVKSKGNKGPDKYWTYRWIHAVDGTSDQPFILELFSSSQPDVFTQICPMSYLVCTQMRVCRVDGSLLYLTSSCETETFTTGCHKGQPYVSDPKVKSFIQWTKTQKDNAVLLRTAIGGHYCYPHPPNVFTQAGVPAQVPLVAAAELKQELENLQYREHKRLAIQGQITAICYMETTESRGTKQKEGSNDGGEQMGSDSRECPQAAERESLASSSSVGSSTSRGKRRNLGREAGQCSLNQASSPAKRRLNREEGEQKEDEGMESNYEENDVQTTNTNQALFWESSRWSAQQHELSEHLSHRGVHQDSIPQRFSLDDKDGLLQWANLQPTRWTAAHNVDPIPPVVLPGYYQVTILGINKQIAVDAAFVPILSSDEPQAVGLPQDPHDNTMLSCLSSGFLCPLTDPDPEGILLTASDLEDTHVVCILDICHLGGDKLEILINKVYRVAEVCLD